MSDYAEITDDIVTNVTVADDPVFAAAMGWVLIDGLTPMPGIGWGYDGTTWTPPDVAGSSSAQDPAVVAALATLQAVADPTQDNPSQTEINQAMATVVLAGMTTGN